MEENQDDLQITGYCGWTISFRTSWPMELTAASRAVLGTVVRRGVGPNPVNIDCFLRHTWSHNIYRFFYCFTQAQTSSKPKAER